MIKRLKMNWKDYLKCTIVFSFMFAGFGWWLSLFVLAARLLFDLVDVYLFLPMRRVHRRDKMNEYEAEDA